MAEQQPMPEPAQSFSDSIYRPVVHTIPLGGVAPDLTLESLGDQYLASAQNLLIRDGRLRQRDGYSTLIGAAGFPNSSAQAFFEWVPYDGSARVVLATLANFYYYATGDQWVNITTTARTGLYGNAITFTPMRTSSSGIRLISINGVDPPTWWSGATASAFVVLSTAVIGTCAIVWRSHYLQGNTTDTADGQVASRVHWSALGDPTVWSGTASAGSLDLIDANASKVLAFSPLRKVLAVYKAESVHALVYKPSPLYFTQTLLHDALTLFSTRSVASVNGGESHFVLTQEGAILWDGQGIRTIGRDRVDRTILRAVEWASRATVWTHYSPVTREVYLSIPITGGQRVTWVYNLDFDSWWETDLFLQAAGTVTQATAAAFVTPGVLCSHSNAASVYQLFSGAGDASASAAIASSFQSGYHNYGGIEHKGIYKMAIIAGPGSGTQAVISITKAGTENPLITPAFGDSQTLTLTTGAHIPKVDFRLTDRWVAYRMTHSGAGETLHLSQLVPALTQRTDARKRR